MVDASGVILRLRAARRSIITVAAEWQAEGLDTEPLNLPLIHIQEALAELEAINLDAEAARHLPVLARELRNHFNAVRVSGAGLETEDDPYKRLRWLDLIEQAADGAIDAVSRMEPLLSDEAP